MIYKNVKLTIMKKNKEGAKTDATTEVGADFFGDADSIRVGMGCLLEINKGMCNRVCSIAGLGLPTVDLRGELK